MQLAQHVCIGLVQRPVLLLDGGTPVLKQRDDVVDMLRLVGLEREEPLEVLDGHAPACLKQQIVLMRLI